MLHRIKPNRLKVSDIPSAKLTKKGDRPSGTIGRCRNFLSKHADEHIDLAILAGTNNRGSRHVSPEELIKKLDESINELTEFHNFHHIFLCQLPPRFDFHNINAKVTCFNEFLIIARFADTDKFVTVLDAVPAEFKYHYHDGLHLSDVGLNKQCSIILSNLYKTLAPASYKQRKESGLAHSTPHKTNARKRVNARRFNQQQSQVASNSLILGCWNVQYFRTAQLYFKSLIECFDVFPISNIVFLMSSWIF